MDFAAAYTEARSRFVDLVKNLPSEQLETVVPACPAWSIQDLVAHVVGVADAFANDRPFRDPNPDEPDLQKIVNWNVPERAAVRDAWTQDMVDSRRGRTLAELLDEFDAHAQTLAGRLGDEAFPIIPKNASVADLATHLHDIRGAVGEPGDRDLAANDVTFEAFFTMLTLRLGATGTPALCVVASGQERVAGSGEPAATIEGDRHEIMRVISGRRSQRQVRAMFAAGDPEAYLDLIATYPLASGDLAD